MRRRLDAVVRTTLGRLHIPFEYHARTNTYIVGIPLDSRGMTLLGLHCHEAGQYIQIESTIFTVPIEHAGVLRIWVLQTPLTFLRFRMTDRHVHLELDLSFNRIDDPVAHLTENITFFAEAIDELYPKLLTDTRPSSLPQSWAVREIRNLLDQIDNQPADG